MGAVIGLVLVIVFGTSVGRSSAPVPQSPAPAGVLSAREAEELLRTVAVKGRAPKTGYSRDAFGDGWASRDGCSVRELILARDLVDIEFATGSKQCQVLSGVLNDPYSGTKINFERGPQTSAAVHVDHRYPLILAWQQGAQQWTQQQREEFANDPGNLQAVACSVNQSKGGSGPGSWLPPNKAYRCTYLITFVQVTAKWKLSINKGDHSMILSQLRKCS